MSDSFGFGVPLMEHRGERDILVGYVERKGADGALEYQQDKNRTSIDGLPAVDL